MKPSVCEHQDYKEAYKFIKASLYNCDKCGVFFTDRHRCSGSQAMASVGKSTESIRCFGEKNIEPHCPFHPYLPFHKSGNSHGNLHFIKVIGPNPGISSGMV